jgi:hypothetical protein
MAESERSRIQARRLGHDRLMPGVASAEAK